jgi:hypothetical protein
MNMKARLQTIKKIDLEDDLESNRSAESMILLKKAGDSTK